MSYEYLIRKYKEGEQGCVVCNCPLPAHETWPGARHPFCGSAECSASLKERNPFEGKNRPGLAAQVGLYVEPSEIKCEGPGCNNFISEGRYDRRGDFVVCSGECWMRRRTKGNRLLTCGCGCNQQFLGRAERKPIDGLYFLSSRHYGVYQHNKYLDETCGAFKDLVREYLDGFATLHYRETQTVRSCVGPFFLFIKEKGISSLDEVTPKTVTQYLSWGEKSGRKIARTISFVSTFFKWALAEGHRNGSNPVVSLIHRSRKQWRMPRPLETEQLDFTWDLLKKRGNARLRLAAAIAQEAGLRIGEICRVRMHDVDLKRQRIFVVLPNKANRERHAFFSEQTKQYYAEWLAERNPNCKHDRLLHNTRLDPCTTATLGQEFKRVLCKTYVGKTRNEVGWEKWSTHALRHTMASNLVSAGADAATVMAAGGWRTYEAMCGYARVDAEVARRGYEEAMKRVQQQKRLTPRKKALSLSEFLELKRKKA